MFRQNATCPSGRRRERGWIEIGMRSWRATAPDRTQLTCGACSRHARRMDRCTTRKDGSAPSGPHGPADTRRRHDNLRAGNGETSPVWAPCPWMAGLLARRSWSSQGPSGSPRLPRVDGNTKERTIRRERGVLPRLIVLPPQWLFRSAVLQRPVAPCDPSPLKRQSGWRTLAAIQSRGRLRSACPVGVHAFAFPFALRTASLPSGNHPR